MMKPKLERIGKGMFTTAYANKSNPKIVYLKSNDRVKECMAEKWFPKTTIFPNVYDSDKPGYDYMMKYYKPSTSLAKELIPSHLEIYNKLSNLRFGVGYKHWYNQFSTIKNRRWRNALLSAIDALANYSEEICFEISRRNVRVSEKGRLILLDTFFFAHTAYM